jgi:hypothetical protein
MNDNEAKPNTDVPKRLSEPFRALMRLIPSTAELIVMQAQGVLARHVEP